MTKETTSSEDVAFDPSLVNVPSMTRQKSLVDYLLTSKAKLLMRYDALFDLLFSFGISPPDTKNLFDHAPQDDMLTAWRVRHSLLKVVNSMSKIHFNDHGSKTLNKLDKTIYDIVVMLMDDFRQIGREFTAKLGNSSHNDYLLKRLKDHKTLMDDVKKHLYQLRPLLTN